MNDVERGRELSRLMKLERKMKKANPAFKISVQVRIDKLMNETAVRFVEVFGTEHPVVQNLIYLREIK